MEILGFNILDMVFAGLVAWSILITVEGLRRLNLVKGEYGRKLGHIFLGIFLASLPLYMGRREIVAINTSLFVGLIIFSGIFHLFKSIEDVKRWTWGQFFFPLGVIAVTVFFKDPVVYSFAVLVLGLSDGFAAVFGKWHGRPVHWAYKSNWSYLGSGAFFTITLTLFAVFLFNVSEPTLLLGLFALACSFILTAVEATLGAGLDNLFVPVLAAVAFELML